MKTRKIFALLLAALFILAAAGTITALTGGSYSASTKYIY